MVIAAVWSNLFAVVMQGVSTPLILKARGMTRSVCVSSVLNTAREARKYIDAGEMMPDHVVGDLLLEALLVPASAGLSAADLNLVVDGFPRTAVQVRSGCGTAACCASLPDFLVPD
jgi:hypothetical protein